MRNRYGLDDHASFDVRPAGRGKVRAVCGCGWKGPLCGRPSAALRTASGLHLRELEQGVEAGWCPECQAPSEGGAVHERCAQVAEILGTIRAGGV